MPTNYHQLQSTYCNLLEANHTGFHGGDDMIHHPLLPAEIAILECCLVAIHQLLPINGEAGLT